MGSPREDNGVTKPASAFAVRKLADKLDARPSDFNLVEINEACATRCVTDSGKLGLAEEPVKGRATPCLGGGTAMTLAVEVEAE